MLDLLDEFKADCLGWQYQLGLLPLLPPRDFAEGLFNSACRPESNGDLVITRTEADQGNLVPMELMKRLLEGQGPAPGGDVPRRALGRRARRPLRSGCCSTRGICGAYAFNHDPATLRGVHSYRQPAGYFPVPGGTFAGESLPGAMTWARAYLRGGELWMDIGRGEVVTLPPAMRDAWWEGTTRAVAVHGGRPRLLDARR